MSQLLIEIDTPEDEALLMQLLPKLNGRVLTKNESYNLEAKRSSLNEAFSQLTDCNVAEKYGDPSKWQQETREDNPLAGRDE